MASTPVCLDPAFSSFVHCASPNSHLIASQSRVEQFNHDAANIFVLEEVVPRKLHVIEIAVYVEKERIAAQTEEKTVVAGFRHQGFSSNWDRCLLDDNFALLALASGLGALSTTNCRRLLSIFGRCELNAVKNIGNDITVCIDLDLVQRSRFEGLARCRLRRVQP